MTQDKNQQGLSGEWIGELQGLTVRRPGDLGLPVLELHGEDGLAATAVSREFVDGLTQASAELNMVLDEVSDE